MPVPMTESQQIEPESGNGGGKGEVRIEMIPDVAVVVIGRNEGERLRKCLTSIPALSCRIYVDSASTDGSAQLARELGFDVVELATPPAFSAARARNVGLRRALELHPGIAYVQMIDGDCELSEGWLAHARGVLEANSRFAAVFGRRRERFPTATIYNRICDAEWDVPVGIVSSCGGDVMLRAGAVMDAKAYCEWLIAGEEPDLCLRLRGAGWLICRTPAEMTVHDIAISRFRQWWKRSARGGHAFAALIFRHRINADPGWLRDLASFLFWDAVALGSVIALLVGIVCASTMVALLAALLALLWGGQLLRMVHQRLVQGEPLLVATRWGGLIMLDKFAQLQGAAAFARSVFLGKLQGVSSYAYKE
ncbi:glycosyltransferase family 2 protein [Rhodovastum atsumiense]|uniref:Glycosyltransferase family 2 protein n=2 Tax=Rhodovastum atsumiense TaxID=504468 RepID=A0A5M6J0K6_9PROT|nr:glycosyltransferase family 2 protein [Rhodovastum atsumiense]